MDPYLRPIVLLMCWVVVSQTEARAAEESPRVTTQTNSQSQGQIPGRGAGVASAKPGSGAPQVDFFRALLAADRAGRQRMLTNVPPEHRLVLVNGVRTYEALPPSERELRLRTMELRFQINGLLRVPPSARQELLERIPQESRGAVQDRLAYWDQLQPDVQKALLEQERLLRLVTVVPASPPKPPGLVLPASAGNLRPVADAAERWQSLPEPKRRQAEDAFNRVFELGQGEIEKVIGPLPLSSPEREAMEDTLAVFRQMTSEQRALCIRNFKRFADLSSQERLAYLRGVEEWRKMSSEDRAAWREVVKRVPQFPPLPPGFGQPPLPPGAAPRMPQPVETVTNLTR